MVLHRRKTRLAILCRDRMESLSPNWDTQNEEIKLGSPSHCVCYKPGCRWDHMIIWDSQVFFHLGLLVGSWATYPSEKSWSESQLGWWNSPIYGKIKAMFQSPRPGYNLYFLTGMSHQVIFNPCSTSIFFHALKPPSRPPGGLTHGSSRHFPLGLESGTVAATGAFRATQNALSLWHPR